MAAGQVGKRGVGLILVLVVLGLVARLWFEDRAPADVDIIDEATSTPRQSAPLTPDTEAEPLAVEPAADAETESAEDAPADSKPSAPWSIRWRLADQEDREVDLYQLLNTGLLPSLPARATITAVDSAGTVDEHRIEIEPFFRVSGVIETSLESPVDVTLDLNRVTFKGVATRGPPTVTLRPTELLVAPDMAQVTFDSKVPLDMVATIETTAYTSRLSTPTIPRGAPIAWFPRGHYEYRAIVGDGRTAYGEFMVHDEQPMIVEVVIAEPTSLSGMLRPAPRDRESVTLMGHVASAPWTSLARTTVAQDGAYRFAQLAPGTYSFVVERRTDEAITLSHTDTDHAVLEGANTATLIDEHVGNEGTLVVRNRGRGTLRIVDTRGTTHAMLPLRDEGEQRFILGRDDYSYWAGGGSTTEPVVREGTFSIGAIPTEIEINLGGDGEMESASAAKVR